MNLSVCTDGGAKGNPGPAAIGLVVYEGEKPAKSSIEKADNELFRYREDIGDGTNNEAEYTAVVRALELIRDKIEAEELEKPERINFYSDSELLVKQLNGIYKVKQAHIRDFVFKIRILESELQTLVTYSHVRREHNKLADALVNDAA